jgi:hypothetical protein
MACTRSFTIFSRLFVFVLGALTVCAHPLDIRDSVSARATQNPWVGTSAFQQIGTSGVSAMQMAVVDERYVILFDKAEHNPLTTSKGKPAWGALLDTTTHKVRALKLLTNSFCAGGSYLYLARYSFLLTICDFVRRRMAWQWHVDRLWWLP